MLKTKNQFLRNLKSQFQINLDKIQPTVDVMPLFNSDDRWVPLIGGVATVEQTGFISGYQSWRIDKDLIISRGYEWHGINSPLLSTLLRPTNGAVEQSILLAININLCSTFQWSVRTQHRPSIRPSIHPSVHPSVHPLSWGWVERVELWLIGEASISWKSGKVRFKWSYDATSLGFWIKYFLANLTYECVICLKVDKFYL